MSPLQLFVSVLAAAAAAAAAPGFPVSTHSEICGLLYGSGDPSFNRLSAGGTTMCRCESQSAASCAALSPYPAVESGSPDQLAAEYHKPSPSAIYALIANQMISTCYYFKKAGRRCMLTWPNNGAGAPFCDCASSEGAVSFRVPFFVDSIRSRSSFRRRDADRNGN